MTTTESIQAFKYDVGEEVVVRLEPGSVIETSGFDPVTAALPPWTIAEITARDFRDGRRLYTVSFTLENHRLTSTVHESAIEGTA